jgi:hypothetical protein
MNLSDFAENKLIDAMFRGQSLGAPATLYFALLTSTHGPRANSTAYSLNNTISVVANDGKVHLYKCTTAGTTAAAQSTLYPGVANEAITDGTAVFTEQTAGLDANTEQTEPSGGGYARVGVTASLANFAGTQSAGSTTASSGTGGQTSNNGAINFASPSANWGFIWGISIKDAASAGNSWLWAPLATVKTVNNGDTAPSLAAGAFTYTLN